MDSHGHPDRLHGIHLCLGQKIAAVYKADADYLTAVLPGIRPFQADERIELVAAVSPHAVYALDSLVKSVAVHIPFPAPGPGQINHLVTRIRQIQAQAHGPLQADQLRTTADKPCAAGKHRHLFIDCIEKHQFHTCHWVLQIQLQGPRLLILLHISGWQARQFRLSSLYDVAFVYKRTDPASIFPSDSISRIPHIPGSKAWVFLLDMFQ